MQKKVGAKGLKQKKKKNDSIDFHRNGRERTH